MNCLSKKFRQAFDGNESGYSLVETLVAMSLFLCVLLPLVTILGNFMMDNSAERTMEVLHIAHSEMTTTIISGDYTDKSSMQSRYIVNRIVVFQSGIATIRIAVCRNDSTRRELMNLQRKVFFGS
jgi:Tfp pilus assembly protein PilV